jgi:hypothetical protein
MYVCMCVCVCICACIHICISYPPQPARRRAVSARISAQCARLLQQHVPAPAHAARMLSFFFSFFSEVELQRNVQFFFLAASAHTPALAHAARMLFCRMLHRVVFCYDMYAVCGVPCNISCLTKICWYMFSHYYMCVRILYGMYGVCAAQYLMSL